MVHSQEGTEVINNVRNKVNLKETSVRMYFCLEGREGNCLERQVLDEKRGKIDTSVVL